MRRSVLLAALAASLAAAQTPQELARDLLRELIEINTTDSAGDNTRAAEAMAARLRAAGFPPADVRVLAPAPRKGNLVARLRGTGAGRPVLFLAHLDVVEARREDWSFDPFRFLERDGYYYGRGTSDMKGDAALYVATFMRLKQEGFRPDRDLILALTADEESGAHNGVEWLLKTHRDLIDAEYCINADAGGGQIRQGRRILYGIQAAEKTYQSFRLEARDKGGHSSLPRKQNAIYELSAALLRLRDFDFPLHLNPVSRAYFRRAAKLEGGTRGADYAAVAQDAPDPAALRRLSANPADNALLRTTCVATELSGGHAENALPQLAAAVVNCRLVPGDSPAAVRSALERVLADARVSIAPVEEAVASPAFEIPAERLRLIEAAVHAEWPGVPVLTVMEAGATDGKYLRIAGIPVYGVSALFGDVDDVRAHGRDERIAVKAFREGLDFDYRLVKAAGTGTARGGTGPRPSSPGN